MDSHPSILAAAWFISLLLNREGAVRLFIAYQRQDLPRLTEATGTAERDTAERLVGDLPGRHRITVAGDKAYDTREFVQSLRVLNAVPHVAQNRTGRSSAIDGRTSRHPGYAISQRLRKRVEEIFGWIKTVGNLRKTRHRGIERVSWMFTLTAAAYILVRIRNLTEAISP